MDQQTNADAQTPPPAALGGGMVQLPTAARTRWRVQGSLVGALAAVPLGGALGLLLWLAVESVGVAVALGVVVVLVGIVVGFGWADRRYARFAYVLDGERLRVRDGVVVHVESVAPLFRVQHVDLTRGPLQLAFDLATLNVHTASPAADVRLPDLRVADAERIRDEILTSSRAAAAALGVEDVDAV